MVDEKEEKLEGEEEGQEPKKKKGKNLVLIIIIAVAVLAGGAGAFFFFTKSGGGKEHKTEETKAQAEGVTFALEPFVVNLSDPTGTRFLKVSLQLELAGPAVMEKAKAKTPQIRDAIITLLTSKTSDALISPEGKLQLKDEINLRINQVLGENSVKNVYLTDFVMQ
ncbi:flagellar basal body-associated protein FliL [Dissulfurispira thermophila]|uniref:Flagellar protein FliL n=1 Tax=Dissulfurispira thermophila TaxID=2715679 RepID=A0A7G1H127_9BACT|nr:flagellar basal body-associated protein FliL [Dissulfurispira thermophila]BCB96464.1 flagellar basal body-associated protein FliL [Dissulfurispira thermophila]